MWKNVLSGLTKADFSEMVQKMNEKSAIQTNLNRQFSETKVFKNMVSTLISSKSQFEEEEFAYFPEKVRARLGWEKFTDSEIKSFVSAMIDVNVGDLQYILSADEEEEDTDSLEFNKNGLFVGVFYGQGRMVIIRSVE